MGKGETTMSVPQFKVNDVVIFGRQQGEKTLGTVTKVNRKTVKVRQEESRGMRKAHKVGTIWTVPYPSSVIRHATPEEAARLEDKGTTPGSTRQVPTSVPSQIPARKPSALPTTGASATATQKAPTIPGLITDGKRWGGAMPGFLEAAQKMVGKTIAGIGYREMYGEFYPVIILDDGTEILTQTDDECNGPGVLYLGPDCVLCQVG
jgi:hypothetical protein